MFDVVCLLQLLPVLSGARWRKQRSVRLPSSLRLKDLKKSGGKQEQKDKGKAPEPTVFHQLHALSDGCILESDAIGIISKTNPSGIDSAGDPQSKNCCFASAGRFPHLEPLIQRVDRKRSLVQSMLNPSKFFRLDLCSNIPGRCSLAWWCWTEYKTAFIATAAMPAPNLVMPLTRFSGGELFLEKPDGEPHTVGGRTVCGELVFLNEGPVTFDARDVSHGGLPSPDLRVVLLAYCLRDTKAEGLQRQRNVRTTEWETLSLRLLRRSPKGSAPTGDVDVIDYNTLPELAIRASRFTVKMQSTRAAVFFT